MVLTCHVPPSVAIWPYQLQGGFHPGGQKEEKGHGGFGQVFLDHMVKGAKGQKAETYERHM